MLIANEAIDSMIKHGSNDISCKLNIEKAYNHVNWDFLIAILIEMGFSQKWIRLSWSDSAAWLAKFSILVNGTIAGFFFKAQEVWDWGGEGWKCPICCLSMTC